MKSSFVNKKTVMIACVLVLLVSCVAITFLTPATTADAHNELPTATVGEIYNSGTSSFNKANMQNLLKQLAGSSSNVTVSDVVSKLGVTQSSGKSVTSANNGNEIIVTFGGIQWIAVYVSLADTSNGTTTNNNGNTPGSGDVILTLWQAYATDTAVYNTWYGTSDTTYPSNMYSTSEIRNITLNAGGSYTTDGSNLTSTTRQTSNTYASFTMSNATNSVSKFVVAPRYVSWQKTQDTVHSIGYQLNNEAWGTMGSNTFYSSDYCYESKTNYNAWRDDLVWLPSLTEINSVGGIWNTTSNQGKNTNYVWTRSAYGSNYWWAYLQNHAGGNTYYTVNNTNGVRPAIHLNLTSAAGAAGIPTTHEHSYEWKVEGNYHYQYCEGCGDSTVKTAHTVYNAKSISNSQHQGTCSVCSTMVTQSHTVSSSLSYDLTGHWYACSGCDYQKDLTSHTWTWSNSSGTHTGKCSANCGVGNKMHSQVTPSSWTSAGTTQHQGTCAHTDGCTVQITLNHTWSTTWTDSGTTHTRGCTSPGCQGSQTHNAKDPTIWREDGTGHSGTCIGVSGCTVKITKSHTYPTTFTVSGTTHTRTCTANGCGVKDEHAEYTPSSWSGKDSDSHWGECGYVGCNNTVKKSHGTLVWNTDDYNHWQKCEACYYETAHSTHNFGDTYYNDKSQSKHYQICQQEGCNRQSARYDHTFGNWSVSGDKLSHEGTCTAKGCDQSNSHRIDTYLPTQWEHDEERHYGTCSFTGCNETVSITHSLSNAWQQDSDNHYKLCAACGYRKTENHNLTTFTDTGDGVYHVGQCIVCGKQDAKSFHESNLEGGRHGDQYRHWYECTICKGMSDVVMHDWLSLPYVTDDQGYHWQYCENCDFTYNKTTHIKTTVAQVDATCNTTGTRAYYKCEICSTCYSDEDMTVKIENIDSWLSRDGGGFIDKDLSTHRWSDWKIDTAYNQHYKTCDVCGEEDERGNHSMAHIEKVAATCQKEGCREYWYCNECEHYFTDAQGSQHIGDEKAFNSWLEDAGKIAVDSENGHKWSEVLSSDVNGHWYACLNDGCTERDREVKHDEAWQSEQQWKDANDGENHMIKCEACGVVVTREAHKLENWTSNGNETHSANCSVESCGAKVSEAHEWSTDKYEHDTNGHWRPCTAEGCLEQHDYTAHSVSRWTSKDQYTHTGNCDYCQKEITAEHVWDWREEGSGQYRRICSANECSYQDEVLSDHVVRSWEYDNEQQHKGLCEVHPDEYIYNDHDWIAKRDANGHWEECAVCGERKDFHEHNYEGASWTVENGKHYTTCNDCGYVHRNEEHKLAKYDEVASTCQEIGHKQYWYCTVCNTYFSDEEGKEQIDNLEEWFATDGAIAKTEHSYDTNWKHDESGHWHECILCGNVESFENHNYENDVCTDCNYTVNSSENGNNGGNNGDTGNPGDGNNGNESDFELDLGIAVVFLSAQAVILLIAMYFIHRKRR